MNNNRLNEIQLLDDEYTDFNESQAGSIEANENATFNNNELDSDESHEYNRDLEIYNAALVEENAFDFDFDEPVFEEDIVDDPRGDEEEEGEDNDDVNENHLPPSVLKYVRDAAKRDSRDSMTVALAFLVMLSTLIRDKSKIYQRQLDLSAVLAANISGLVVSDSRRTNKFGIKNILKMLFMNTQLGSNESSSNVSGHFDFDKFIVKNRREFSRGKIKFVKPSENGSIEAIYTKKSYEKYGNLLNADEQNFFTTISEKYLSDLVGKHDDASLFNDFVLVHPSPRDRKVVDVNIDEAILREANKIFSQTEASIVDLEANPIILHFADDARQFYYDFVNRLENTLKTVDEHPALIAYLAGFEDLFAKFALLLYILECGEAGIKIDNTCTVDLTAAKRAAAWCEILEIHARSTVQSLFAKHSVENLIMQKIDEGKLSEIFTAREIMRAHWTNLKKPFTEIKKALDGLVEDGKIRILPKEMTGRPTTRYESVDIEEVEVDLDSETTDKREDE